MHHSGAKCRWKRLIAGSVFAVSVFLLPVENALAISNFSFLTSFTSADTAPFKNYMDSAGTWNNALNAGLGAEVTDTTGDAFTFTFTNTGPDTAFDFDLNIIVPTGFRLPAAINSVSVTSLTPAACSTLNNISLSQSSPGAVIDFSIAGNSNIPSGCSYQFVLGLTTNDAAPFAVPGLRDVQLNVVYNEIDNSSASQQTASITHQVQVNTADVLLTKTSLTPIVANGGTATFSVQIQNVGTGGLFHTVFTDVLSTNLTGLGFSAFTFSGVAGSFSQPTQGTGAQSNQFTFDYLPANVIVDVTVTATAVINPTATTCPVLVNDASAIERTTVSSSDFASVDFNLSNMLQLTHDLTNSYCELCGQGEVRIVMTNVGGVSLINMNLEENLGTSTLSYVNNSTQISIDGGPFLARGNPSIAGTLLTWDAVAIPELGQLNSSITLPQAASPRSITVSYRVQRALPLNQEDLVNVLNRDIQTTSNYTLICGGIGQTTSSSIDELPVRQPLPQVTKLGRNIDAGQGTYRNFVYGHIDDDIIWRVDVANTGLADLQDLLIDDRNLGFNLDINWVCNTEANAINAAGNTTGPTPTGCVASGSPLGINILDFNVDDPFGNPDNDESATFVDVPAGGNGFLFYVGRIRQFCANQSNDVNIEWGCEIDSPDGGITVPAANGGVVPAFNETSTADLSTTVVPGNMNVQQNITGIDGVQPVGSKGLVTIQITNLTGGSVNGIDFTDNLPAEYVVDTTFTPTAVVDPFLDNATYPGMVDTITWDNQNANPLNNTSPHFVLTSSTNQGTGSATDPLHNDLLRHGDLLTIQFRVVLIDTTRYDLVADVDVTPEVVADNTDPDNTFTLTNQVVVNFSDICSPINSSQITSTNNAIPAFPEDLDVAISDALFILTNDPGFPLLLNVSVTNNGGHDADDYFVFVTFGQAMTVDTAPAGCVVTTNPPPRATWNDPAPIPATAAVYICDRGIIAPGVTENFTFDVIKNTNAAADDDLTFRADVVGEITLSDATPLIFPAVDTSVIANTANNYTLDAVRSRVLGFNLTKVSQATCTENNPPPATPDLLVQIGEDCNYHIESGGWFGFLTPGFTLIAVENVIVTDDLPNGQGYISHNFNNTVNISPVVINGGSGSSSLDETDINWAFNATGNGIVVKDEFFRVDITTRLLNDPVDLSYPVVLPNTPNLHALSSTNTARTSFDAIFNSVSGNLTVSVDDASAIPGYPDVSVRQVSLTVTEPNLIITKQVCNETLNGEENNSTGTVCSNYVDLANDGDTQDSYVYRITIQNQQSSGGVQRAPAYNVIINDLLDASDLMFVNDFDNDNLDNDGDGVVDEGGEALIISDNIIDNGNPAEIQIDHTHSVALERVEPNQSITLYYRVNPDDAIAPAQLLTNTVSTTYDSLEGNFGNQNAPQLNNATVAPNDVGRARIYTAIDANAQVRMLPLQTQPKQIISVSNSTLATPQNVVVGEEILYELHAQIPVANLRSFVIRDELPPGIRCVDAQTINLDIAPYNAAGFFPGGTFVLILQNP